MYGGYIHSVCTLLYSKAKQYTSKTTLVRGNGVMVHALPWPPGLAVARHIDAEACRCRDTRLKTESHRIAMYLLGPLPTSPIYNSPETAARADLARLCDSSCPPTGTGTGMELDKKAARL
jgi:hypothetical protein